jgi:A/G-specific adenine glycosylase
MPLLSDFSSAISTYDLPLAGSFSALNISEFQNEIKRYYKKYARMQPWRYASDSYHVFVSEIMLQQTQVPRVLLKFPGFIERFPSYQSLASASLEEVIAAWQGLGYNRRARFLRESAIRICTEYGGILPDDPNILKTLPGIGSATAGSLCAFSYNLPVIFIETNIRRVFIYSFFKEEIVQDACLYPLVESALERDNPREWYYALMDYGTMLAKVVNNPNRRSAHYTRQSAFEGSDRQIRGAVLRALIEGDTKNGVKIGFLTEHEITCYIAKELGSVDSPRVKQVLKGLTSDKLVDCLVVAEKEPEYRIAQ